MLNRKLPIQSRWLSIAIGLCHSNAKIFVHITTTRKTRFQATSTYPIQRDAHFLQLSKSSLGFMFVKMPVTKAVLIIIVSCNMTFLFVLVRQSRPMHIHYQRDELRFSSTFHCIAFHPRLFVSSPYLIEISRFPLRPRYQVKIKGLDFYMRRG